ncbi:F-box only protein 21-like isoform X2 [Anoplolepis gracilipes]|uniref:F-box only protein 21-like isoform X2 n=1 Tax=Anoplolepis gracilipes TaxID=354296 RepID=UPI003B9FD7FF
MATIMSLPEEIIDIILGYSHISIEDIINFRCVCKKFRHAAKRKKFMENKFFQRWPTARKHYNKQFKENEQKESEKNEQKDKKNLNFIKMGIYSMRLLQNYTQLKHNYFYYHSINTVMQMGHLCGLDVGNMSLDKKKYKNERDIKISFYMDEIKNLLTQFSRKSVCKHLTDKYYSLKVFIFLKQHKLQRKLDKFEEQPCIMQLIEQCATFMAEKLQPQKEVFYSTVTASLDSMARDVLNNLRKKHPDHLILSTSAEQFCYWRNNNIDDNYWNEVEGIQIMDTLEEYIFDKLNFRPNNSGNIEWDIQLKYKCIDHVLEHKYGQEIIIYTIYHSVARRLGLRCDIIIGYPDERICLFWKPSYVTNSSENVRCFRINSNQFPDCFIKQQSISRFEVITSKKMHRILLQLIQFNDKYSWNICPPECHLQNSRLNFNWNDIYLKNWFSDLKKNKPHYAFILEIEKLDILNTKSEEVKFAVGTIVTHGNQSTDRSAGVIIGRHRYENRDSVKVIVRDARYNPQILPLKICSDIKKQTHYLILTENNEICYVGEDSITLTTPKWIENDEVGRYFDKFEGTHYVPNKKLADRYPYDAIVTVPIAISEN